MRYIKASSCMNECSMHGDGYTHPPSSECNPERLEAEEGPHHARMYVDLVNLARRPLNVLSQNAIPLSNKGREASIISSMVHYDGAGRVRAPSISTRTVRTKEMGDVLNIGILRTIRWLEADVF